MKLSVKSIQSIGAAIGVSKKEDSGAWEGTKFGTFGGVFSPTVLTILGVIMYLRLGWVVGNAGLLGAIIIILLAKSITICTGLSMSSITTNIKIGAGGAYSIIAKSLGLETGGSVGIPFYISQTLSAALYIIGFTEGWISIFSTHPPLIVSLLTWAVLMAISYISTRFAIRIQYIILAIIGISIVSFVMTPNQPLSEVPLLGDFQDADFWQVFAIFFPAVTGIMAGANMSGDLKNPGKSLPLGTFAAVGLSIGIYFLAAVVFSAAATRYVLVENVAAMKEVALLGAMITAGVVAATLSSAMASFLGAPRILQSLAQDRIFGVLTPFAKGFGANANPRRGVLLSCGIAAATIALGKLNLIAPVVSMDMT